MRSRLKKIQLKHNRIFDGKKLLIMYKIVLILLPTIITFLNELDTVIQDKGNLSALPKAFKYR